MIRIKISKKYINSFYFQTLKLRYDMRYKLLKLNEEDMAIIKNLLDSKKDFEFHQHDKFVKFYKQRMKKKFRYRSHENYSHFSRSSFLNFLKGYNLYPIEEHFKWNFSDFHVLSSKELSFDCLKS